MSARRKPRTAAERQRRFRERRRRGAFMVPVEITAETVDALVTRGDIPETGTQDTEILGAAIAELVSEQAKNRNA